MVAEVEKRVEFTQDTKLRIWAAAAGRCVLCSAYLLDDQAYYRTVKTGQVAHIVGATSGRNSPRGESDLSGPERADADNLMLLCLSCHTRMDDRELRELYPVEFLTAKKYQHERRVREVTAFETLRETTVVKMSANVRGAPSMPTNRQIAEALVADSLTGFGADTRTGLFEIDLPDGQAESWVWEAGRSRIDKEVEKLSSAIAASDMEVVSVFALAPIPLLAYLGSRLDDKYEVRLFPRQRRDDVLAWTWPVSPTSAPKFDVAMHVQSGDPRGVQDVVAHINISAPVKDDNVPVSLRDLPSMTLAPAEVHPNPEVIDSPEALSNAAAAWRDALARVETVWPRCERIHVLAAIPNTVAIQLGRNHMRSAQPELVFYQLTNNGYEEAVSIA